MQIGWDGMQEWGSRSRMQDAGCRMQIGWDGMQLGWDGMQEWGSWNRVGSGVEQKSGGVRVECGSGRV